MRVLQRFHAHRSRPEQLYDPSLLQHEHGRLRQRDGFRSIHSYFSVAGYSFHDSHDVHRNYAGGNGLNMKRLEIIRSFRCAEGGDTLIEFAISAVITVSLLLGVMDLSRAVYTYHFISSAAELGARFAEVHGSGWPSACSSSSGTSYSVPLGCTASKSDVQAYVQSLTPPAINKANLTVTPQWLGKDINGSTTICGTTSNKAGCLVQVNVSYQFTYMIPFVPTAAQTLTATAQAVITE